MKTEEQPISTQSLLVFNNKIKILQDIAANYANSNTVVSGARGLRLKSRAGQVRHIVASGRHRYNNSSKGVVLPGRNDAEMDPVNSLHAST